MAKIGFKLQDVKQGGTHETLFYNQVVLQDRKRARKNGYIIIEVDDSEIDFNFLSTYKDDIIWEGVSIWVEANISLKTAQVPSWLPNNTYLDENGDEQTHTIESWDGILRDNLAGTKMIVKLTQFGDIEGADFDSLVAFIDAQANRIGLTVQEARDLIATSAYTITE